MLAAFLRHCRTALLWTLGAVVIDGSRKVLSGEPWEVVVAESLAIGVVTMVVVATGMVLWEEFGGELDT